MRVGIVGDSQSEGLAPYLVPLLRARGDQVVDTQLQRGMSLANMRASAERTARARDVARKSDTLIVILGGNNRGTDPGRYQELADWFLRDVARGPSKIWWVGPAASVHPEWGPYHARTREMQRQLLPGAARVTWIDAWPMTRAGVQYAADSLHFTRAGYEVWAGRLIGHLRSSAGVLVGAALGGVALGLFLATIGRR